MKKEQLFEAIGEIEDKYVKEARSSEKTLSRALWARFGLMAACMCLCVVAVFVLIKTDLKFGPEMIENENYANTVAYAGWTSDASFYEGALNSDKLFGEGNHLPVFKIDTVSELEDFRSAFGSVFALDQGYANVLSFNGAVERRSGMEKGFTRVTRCF